jgi:3-dehydroquinate synthase
VIRIPVAVGGSSYDVVVGTGLLGEAAVHLPPPGAAEKAFVVTDQEVASRYLEPLQAGLAREPWGLQSVHLPVPQGEPAKTIAVAEALYHQLALQEAHRSDLVVALGGGVVGDVAGFVAATYMRGVPFLQVPTTLTAQVDAAIGGKAAVNLPAGKNLVGAFHQPRAVLADVGTLATLPEREFRSGLAEVAKYGLTLDPGLLDLLERGAEAVLARDPAALEDVVGRSVRAKAAVVATDERDQGPRLVLNYGHTLGHALERMDDFGGRSHGEAVAVGMVFAARLSERLGMAGPSLAARHQRLLSALALPTGGPLPDVEGILEAFRMDKKHQGTVRFVLLEDVGVPRVVDAVTEEAMREVLEDMGASR